MNKILYNCINCTKEFELYRLIDKTELCHECYNIDRRHKMINLILTENVENPIYVFLLTEYNLRDHLKCIEDDDYFKLISNLPSL